MHDFLAVRPKSWGAKLAHAAHGFFQTLCWCAAHCSAHTVISQTIHLLTITCHLSPTYTQGHAPLSKRTNHTQATTLAPHART